MADDNKDFQPSTTADKSMTVQGDNNNSELNSSCPINQNTGKTLSTNKKSNSSAKSNVSLEASLKALRTLQQALMNPVASEALTSALESMSNTGNARISVRNRVISVLARHGNRIEESMDSNSNENSAPNSNTSSLQAPETTQPVLRAPMTTPQSPLNSTKTSGVPHTGLDGCVTINTVHNIGITENKADSLRVAETNDDNSNNYDDSEISCVADFAPCETSISYLFGNINRSSFKASSNAGQAFQKISNDPYAANATINASGTADNGLINPMEIGGSTNAFNNVINGNSFNRFPKDVAVDIAMNNEDSKSPCSIDASLEAWRKLDRTHEEPSVKTMPRPLPRSPDRFNMCGGVLSNDTNAIILPHYESPWCKHTITDSARGQNNIYGDMVVGEKKRQAKIVLRCEPKSQEFQTRTIFLTPNTVSKVGRRIKRKADSAYNAIFDCKVMSRGHAILWYTDDGKFWIKDTNSSHGTFLNEIKLDDEAAELHTGDILQFGIYGLEKSGKGSYVCIIANVQLYQPDETDTSTQPPPFLGNEMSPCASLFEDSTWAGSSKLSHYEQEIERNSQLMDYTEYEKTLQRNPPPLPSTEVLHEQPTTEAFIKVCQERWEALQLLTKMENSYAQSDSQCQLLREEITFGKQSIQEVSKRLARIETEYEHYKVNTSREMARAKKLWERREHLMAERFLQRDVECEELKVKLRQLTQKVNMPVGEGGNRSDKKSFQNLDGVNRIEYMNLASEELKSKLSELTATDVNESGADEFVGQADKRSYEQLDCVIKDMNLGFNYGAIAFPSGDGVHKKANTNTVTDSHLSKDCFVQFDDYDWNDKQDTVMSEGESSIAEDADVCANSNDFGVKLARVRLILQQLDRNIFRSNDKKSTTSNVSVACTDDNMLLLKQCVDVFLDAYRAFVSKTNERKKANSTTPTTSAQAYEPNKLLPKTHKDDTQDESCNRPANTVISVWPADDEIGEETEADDAEKKVNQNVESTTKTAEKELQTLYNMMRNQQTDYEENIAQLHLIINNLRAENAKLMKTINDKIAENEKLMKMDAKAEVDMNEEMKLPLDTELNANVLNADWDMNPNDGLDISEPKAQTELMGQSTEVQDTYVSTSSQSSSYEDEIDSRLHDDIVTISEIVQNRVHDAVIYKKYLKKAQKDNAKLRETVAHLQNPTPRRFLRLLGYRVAAFIVIMAVLYYLGTNY